MLQHLAPVLFVYDAEGPRDFQQEACCCLCMLRLGDWLAAARHLSHISDMSFVMLYRCWRLIDFGIAANAGEHVGTFMCLQLCALCLMLGSWSCHLNRHDGIVHICASLISSKLIGN